MNLLQAIRMPDELLRAAIIGSGGKTTALFQLARLLPAPVVVTVTTHLGKWQVGLADQHLIVTRPEDIESKTGQIEGVCLLTGEEGHDDRIKGLDGASLSTLERLSASLKFPLLVEADGSRQKPLKAPAEYEPVVPEWVNMVIVVCGVSGLGKPLDDQTVHRASLYSELSQLRLGELISEEAIAKVLCHPRGGLKGIPQGAYRIMLINQADDEGREASSLRIANLVTQAYDQVLIGSLQEQLIKRVVEPVAGVILAGGGSSRFGQPKMLVPWKGKPLIAHVVEEARKSHLSPIVVVTGSEDAAIRTALVDYPDLIIQHNDQWQDGQSTSLRKGVQSIQASVGAAIFFLADQPFVNREIVSALVDRHQKHRSKVIVPVVHGKRTNPVLFDQSTFGRLAGLSGDVGGRALFAEFGMDALEWKDERLLYDIDTPEDYEKMKSLQQMDQ